MEPCDACGKTEGLAPAGCWDLHLCDVVMPTTPIAPKAFTPEGRWAWEAEMREIYGDVAPLPLSLPISDAVGPPRPRTTYTVDVEAQVHKLYVTERLTAAQVVAAMPDHKLTEHGIHQMAMRRGWRKGQTLKYDRETVRRVYELREAGLSRPKIAKELGTMSKHAVEQMLTNPRYKAMAEA